MNQRDNDRSSAAEYERRALEGVGDEEAVRRSGLTQAHRVEQNHLLRALPAGEYQELMMHLVPVRLRLKQVLIEADEPIEAVYFVREGVCSMIATQQEGGDIEVGTIGNEGFVGVPVLLGADRISNRVFIQVEGDAWRLTTDAFLRLVEQHSALRRLLLRYAQHLTDQLAQAVACNRLHTLEERCARWLLMTHDRVQDDDFELTHEFLALMLGVRRAGVTVAMGTLQRAGTLRYTRGRVHVVDRRRLEESSCDCYRITRASLDRLFSSVS